MYKSYSTPNKPIFKNDFQSRTFIEDSKIIIPNLNLPIPNGGLKSYSMELYEFKDLIIGFSKNVHNNKIESVISSHLITGKDSYTRRFVRLENGFCYAEILVIDPIYPPCVAICYYNGKTFDIFYPLRGNVVNRITNLPINGSNVDKFWLWEELNWGQKRPRGPINVQDIDFHRLVFSLEIIEEEIKYRAEILSKEELESSKTIITPIPVIEEEYDYYSDWD